MCLYMINISLSQLQTKETLDRSEIFAFNRVRKWRSNRKFLRTPIIISWFRNVSFSNKNVHWRAEGK